MCVRHFKLYPGNKQHRHLKTSYSPTVRRPPGGPNCNWAPGGAPVTGRPVNPVTTCCKFVEEEECFLNCRGGGMTVGRVLLFEPENFLGLFRVRSKIMSSAASTDEVSTRWWSLKTAKWGWEVDNNFFRCPPIRPLWQVSVGLEGSDPLSLSPWPESAFTLVSSDDPCPPLPPVATVELLEVFRSLDL